MTGFGGFGGGSAGSGCSASTKAVRTESIDHVTPELGQLLRCEHESFLRGLNADVELGPDDVHDFGESYKPTSR